MNRLDVIGAVSCKIAFVCGLISMFSGCLRGHFDEASYGVGICILMFLFMRFYYMELTS